MRLASSKPLRPVIAGPRPTSCHSCTTSCGGSRPHGWRPNPPATRSTLPRWFTRRTCVCSGISSSTAAGTSSRPPRRPCAASSSNRPDGEPPRNGGRSGPGSVPRRPGRRWPRLGRPRCSRGGRSTGGPRPTGRGTRQTPRLRGALAGTCGRGARHLRAGRVPGLGVRPSLDVPPPGRELKTIPNMRGSRRPGLAHDGVDPNRRVP